MKIDFALILTLLALVTGLVWLADKLAFEKRRKAADPEAKDPVPVEYAKSLFPVIFAVLALRSFLAEPFRIPSGSMMPNLLIGDFILVNKFDYGIRLPVLNKKVVEIGQPARGDVMVFRYPGMGEGDPAAGTDYIKRVIGLPGDRIEMRGGELIINGKAVKRAPKVERLVPVDANDPCTQEDYPDRRVAKDDGTLWCKLPIVRETLPNGRSYDTVDVDPNSPGDNYGPITVPDGHFFLMGDNRDHSADSRFPQWQRGLGGPVPWENIGGKAEIITFSLDGTSNYLNPLSWFRALRPDRTFVSLEAKKDGE